MSWIQWQIILLGVLAVLLTHCAPQQPSLDKSRTYETPLASRMEFTLKPEFENHLVTPDEADTLNGLRLALSAEEIDTLLSKRSISRSMKNPALRAVYVLDLEPEELDSIRAQSLQTLVVYSEKDGLLQLVIHPDTDSALWESIRDNLVEVFFYFGKVDLKTIRSAGNSSARNPGESR